MQPRIILPAIFISIAAVTIANAEAFKLKDGSIIFGDLVSRGDSGLVIKTKHLGELRVDPGNLACTGIEALGGAYCSDERITEDPEGDALFLHPTAFTPAARSGSFKDAELIFLNLGFAPTAYTSITGGFLFPFNTDLQLLTGAVKQRLWQSDSGLSAVAVGGSITEPVGDFSREINHIFNVNLIGSMRAQTTVGRFNDGVGLHASLGYLWEQRKTDRYIYDLNGNTIPAHEYWTSKVTFGFGSELRLTKHVKLIGEYINTPSFYYLGNPENVEGLATVGLRLHGAKLAADIAGIRPLTDDDLGSFFAFPLLSISYRIGN